MSRPPKVTTGPRGECACPRLATTPQTMCSVCRAREYGRCSECGGSGEVLVREQWEAVQPGYPGDEYGPCPSCNGSEVAS